ncbi:MAG: DUF3298 and DUF4163 domain-containing protein [Treponema sp.]|nr:DUF3298 and DUF4163 domain-containing protein [Treponema sp.]
MKKRSSIFTFIPFFFIVILFISCSSIPDNETKTVEKKTFEYKTVTISENLECLSTKIEYPDFYSYPELSRRIKNTVENEWKSFRSYSQSGWTEINSLNNLESGNKYPPFEYNTTFQVTVSASVISVLLNTYLFSGGAHGNTVLISYNYDTSNGTFINITQASGMSYNQISELCRDSLQKKLIDNNPNVSSAAEIVDMKEMINSGAFPQAGNFEIFTLKGKKMTVYFEPYSVAPYVYGIQSVEIPLK